MGLMRYFHFYNQERRHQSRGDAKIEDKFGGAIPLLCE
jgi:hypothetical protein